MSEMYCDESPGGPLGCGKTTPESSSKKPTKAIKKDDSDSDEESPKKTKTKK